MSNLDPWAPLTAALRERLAIIADRQLAQRDPSTHLAQLQKVSERITTLTQSLPKPVDPQLTHYLQRCSYDKALAWLEDFAPSKSS